MQEGLVYWNLFWRDPAGYTRFTEIDSMNADCLNSVIKTVGEHLQEKNISEDDGEFLLDRLYKALEKRLF